MESPVYDGVAISNRIRILVKPKSYQNQIIFRIQPLFQIRIINIFRDKKKKSGNRDDYWTFQIMVRVTGVEPAAS